MDYECDFGFFRADGKTCERKSVFDDEEKQANWEKEQAKQWKETQCSEGDYYEGTTGYRKIPGDICYGGVQLEPPLYACNSGFASSFFSFRSLVMWGVLGAVLYFGWPIIEAILIVLPIPDPS